MDITKQTKKSKSIITKVLFTFGTSLIISICILWYNAPSGIGKDDFEKAVKTAYQSDSKVNGVAYSISVDKYSDPYKITFSWRDHGLYTNKPVSEAYKENARREMAHKLKREGIKKNDYEIIN